MMNRIDKDAYYFPHYSNARHDRKLQRIRKKFGNEGYALYFMLLEVLRDQTDFRYPIADLDLLEDDFRASPGVLEELINDFDLFEIDQEENFFSPNFIQYLSPYLEKKDFYRVNGIKGNLLRHNHITKEQLSQMSNNEILQLNEKVKGNLGGEVGGYIASDSLSGRNKQSKQTNKVNERDKARPSLKEVLNFFEQQDSNSNEAKKFFNHYEGIGWLVNDQPVVDWQSLARNWMLRGLEYQDQNGYGKLFTYEEKVDLITSRKKKEEDFEIVKGEEGQKLWKLKRIKKENTQ